MIDAFGGPQRENNILSTLNLPSISHNNLKWMGIRTEKKIDFANLSTEQRGRKAFEAEMRNISIVEDETATYNVSEDVLEMNPTDSEMKDVTSSERNASGPAVISFGMTVCADHGKKRGFDSLTGAVEDPSEVDNSGTNNDEIKVRGTWGRKAEYILSLVGYLVGLGNLWRFPYICLRNGGGAFLIPFLIFLVIFAFPLVFLEMSIGQFSGKSFLHIWEVCPLFKGLGWGMLIICLTWIIYYNAILAWTIYYIVKSFASSLPWTTCDNEWNSPFCVIDQGQLKIADNQSLIRNLSTPQNASFAYIPTFITASEDFWQRNVLEISSGIEEVGHISWRLLLCFLAGWIIVGICICKGVKSVGKVVYVTALLPYLILTAILIRALMIEGSIDGVIKYLKPDFSKLLSFQIWLEAALQLFYSIGPGTGLIISLSSFNKFHNNFLRDSVFITFASECTSMFSGLVIFSVLGFMSAKQSIPIEKIVKSGPGLGFVVYPEALAYLPGQNVWAVLFFVMLLSVGLDSQFVMCESIVVCFKDSFRLLRKREVLFTAVFCTVSFLTGIIFCSQGGMYVYQLVDWYIAAFALPIMAFLECIIFSWIYGLDNFSNDVRLMIGRDMPLFHRICLGIITPFILLVLIISAIIGYQPPTYGSYEYPEYASIIGSIIATIPLVPIVVVMVTEIYKSPGNNLMEKVMHSLKPSKNWKPVLKD